MVGALRPLALIDCAFSGPLCAETAAVAGLDLSGSQLPALAATGLRTRGRVVLDRVAVDGAVILDECRIGGSLHARTARFGLPRHGDESAPDAPAMSLGLGQIEGEVDLTASHCYGETVLLGATIGGQLNCRGGRFTNPSGQALNASGVTVARALVLDGDFRAAGQVLLRGAQLDQHAVITGSLDAGKDRSALTLERARVTTTLTLDPTQVRGVVDLTDATVGTLRDSTRHCSRRAPTSSSRPCTAAPVRTGWPARSASPASKPTAGT